MQSEDKAAQPAQQESPADSSAIITVVRDPKHTLGKKFSRNTDGTVTKTASVSVSLGIAVMHQVETHDELAALLKKVGEDSHAAIINASFDGIEVGEKFVILSELKIEKQFGIPRSDREKQKGIHELTLDGKTYRAVGRFKENLRPSCWQYFDRDTDKHTPAKFATLLFDEWMTEIGEMLPGFAGISYCRTDSTSSRVSHNGVAVGGGNGHTWFKVRDPADIERFRTAIMVCAAQAKKTWLKPRHSGKEPGKVVGHSLTTIIDPSVFTPGRLIFVGKPVVSEGLAVEAPSVTVYIGDHDQMDTAMTVLPDAQTVREITGMAGVAMDVRSTNSRLKIIANDLTWDTELETQNLGVITVGAYKARGIKSKIRCQTPFRESSSFAAFIALDSLGNPFVYDAGTSTTHRLADAKFEEFEPCDYEIIEGEALPTMPPNPFEKFSLLGHSKNIEKQAGDEKMLLGNVAVLGQLTAIYADPNTGKTLIVIFMLIEAIRLGRIKASQVFYINVDDNLNGLLQKLRTAEEFDFHMVADGHQGFKVTDFMVTLTEMIEQDQACGVVIILDTLKKFSNLMDKARTTGFNKILRRFAMKGGTVIALAHTNKKRDADGKPIYAGTSDVVEDFDCAYLMMAHTGPEFTDRKVVQFENIKRRGNVALTAAYAYSIAPDQTYDQLLASVEEVADVELLPMRMDANVVAEKAITEAIADLIGSGTNTKMALAEAAAARVGISKRKVLQVLEKCTGTDPAFRKWTFAVKERGAKVYALLPELGAAAANTGGSQA